MKQLLLPTFTQPKKTEIIVKEGGEGKRCLLVVGRFYTTLGALRGEIFLKKSC